MYSIHASVNAELLRPCIRTNRANQYNGPCGSKDTPALAGRRDDVRTLARKNVAKHTCDAKAT